MLLRVQLPVGPAGLSLDLQPLALSPDSDQDPDHYPDQDPDQDQDSDPDSGLVFVSRLCSSCT